MADAITRLEARWRDLQAAWGYLAEARAERKVTVERWRARIKVAQESLDVLLRESSPDDPTEHFRECQSLFAKVEGARKSLAATRMRLDAMVAEREAAFEGVLHSNQLPLFTDETVSLAGSVELADGHLVQLSERLYVRGRSGGAATVKGFRVVDGVELVVLRDEQGVEFEAFGAALGRAPEDLEPDAEATGDPAQPTLELAEPAPKRGRRASVRIGDTVQTPDGQHGTMIRAEDHKGIACAIVQLDGGGKRRVALADLTKRRRRAEATV